MLGTVNLFAPVAALIIAAVSIEPAIAGVTGVPAPIVGAGLPALAILAGGYWLVEPALDAELALIACGAVVHEAREALELIREDVPGAGLLIVTSIDRLEHHWRQSLGGGHARSHVERLLSALPATAGLVSVIDGHPAALSWLGAVGRHRTIPLGVDHFGQSGDIPDLYRICGIDADAIVEAAAHLIAPA